MHQGEEALVDGTWRTAKSWLFVERMRLFLRGCGRFSFLFYVFFGERKLELSKQDRKFCWSGIFNLIRMDRVKTRLISWARTPKLKERRTRSLKLIFIITALWLCQIFKTTKDNQKYQITFWKLVGFWLRYQKKRNILNNKSTALFS